MMLKLLILGGAVFSAAYFFLDKDYSYLEELSLNSRKKDPVITDNKTYTNNQEYYKPTTIHSKNQDPPPKVINVSTNENIINLSLSNPNINSALDVDEVVYTFNNGKEQNAGPEINADDTSYIFDNSEEKNVGITIDANDPTFFYDNSKSQDTGNILDASKENNTYKQGPEQNIGPALNADM